MWRRGDFGKNVLREPILTHQKKKSGEKIA
jgi:hypothetical protein